MPLYNEEDEETPPSVVVSASIAAELEWAMHGAWSAAFRRDNAILTRVYALAPELGERIRSFWSVSEATECSGSMELLVLAQHGGLLFSLDADELLGRLEELGATAPLDLRMGSESEPDRAALRRRLDRLRSSPELRQRYAELVSDVWSAFGGDWRSQGLRAVEAAIQARRELQQRGASWREVVRNGCNPEFGHFNELVASLGQEDVIAVVPAFFAHRGSVIDLPGIVLVGVRAEGGGAAARVRTELLARRLKTISDPTRLAMLELLSDAPSTVSQLADLFSLAQPTVSNHVKVLRDAGLVASRSQGRSRQLVVQRDVLEDLVEHLQGILPPSGGIASR
jgi:DNA-binding transcriptional ArsR family regulator